MGEGRWGGKWREEGGGAGGGELRWWEKGGGGPKHCTNIVIIYTLVL